MGLCATEEMDVGYDYFASNTWDRGSSCRDGNAPSRLVMSMKAFVAS